MRVFVYLSVLLAAGVAQAQTYVTTVNRDSRTVTTTGNGYTATTRHVSSNSVTYTTTIVTRSSSAYHPMGASGYSPMGH